MQLILNGDSRPILFFMTASTDHVSGLTGSSPAVTISKNGGTFAGPSGAVTEVGNGWYKLSPAGADVTTNGVLLLHATATGGDPSDVKCQVVAFDPFDATNLGLTNLDAEVSSRVATAALPPNFSLLAIGGAGSVTAASDAPSVSDIVAGVWDGLAVNHAVTGSLGKALGGIAGLAVDGDGAVAANNLVTGLLDLADGVETGVTLRQAQRLQAAYAAGVVSGADGATITIQAAGNPSQTRIVAGVDDAGNRDSVTLVGG